MSLIESIKRGFRQRACKREIEASLNDFKRRTGADSEKKQVNSDSGSFRSQVDRLFALGNLSETGDLEQIATAAVATCITNRYYRPADFLSDMLDALETHTFLSLEPGGEPPIDELDDNQRAMKLEVVKKSWLVPLKVASIESLVATFATTFKRQVRYREIAAFERRVARLYSYLGEHETTSVERRLTDIIERIGKAPDKKPRAVGLVAGLDDCVAKLEGRTPTDADVRARSPRLPIRMATLEPDNRHDFLVAVLGPLGE